MNVKEGDVVIVHGYPVTVLRRAPAQYGDRYWIVLQGEKEVMAPSDIFKEKADAV
jgi:hypothetical protein